MVSQGTKLPPPLASPRARSVPDVVVLGNLCGLRLIYVLTEDPYGYSDRPEQRPSQAPWGGPWCKKTSRSRFAQTLRVSEELCFTRGTPFCGQAGELAYTAFPLTHTSVIAS